MLKKSLSKTLLFLSLLAASFSAYAVPGAKRGPASFDELSGSYGYPDEIRFCPACKAAYAHSLALKDVAQHSGGPVKDKDGTTEAVTADGKPLPN